MKNKQGLLNKLEQLVKEGERVKADRYSDAWDITRIDPGAFDAWRNKILAYLAQYDFIPTEFIVSIKKTTNSYPVDVEDVQQQLVALTEFIANDYLEEQLSVLRVPHNMETNIESIFNRFHRIARQLRTRHENRTTLNISDEYDVQDLLHALLLLFYDDVRSEEWTPSYAGGCGRMDFLLKDIQAVIEVKKTRESMSAKDLGEQLIVDIEKYKHHPLCKKLYCFVYDPEGLLGNPNGIKSDLENANEGFLKVFIKPE